MAERHVKIWYDPEGDYLEVIFDQKPGYFRETVNDQVMEKVKEAPLEVSLCSDLSLQASGSGVRHSPRRR